MNSASWIDIHAHLADLNNENLEKTLATCKKDNVKAIINSATDIKSAEVILKQISNNHQLFGTVGISPFETQDLGDDWQIKLKEILQVPSIIALGEIGLDNTNPIYPHIDIQKQIFIEQLDIAASANIPVIVHSRGSEEEVLKYLIDKNIKKAIFHCYTGPEKLIPNIVKHGYYISFSGIVTFKKAPLDEQVKATPLSNIFIETDTPYLTPHPYRGKKNEPAFVSFVGEKVAQLKEISSDELKLAIEKNFKTLFNVSPY